MYQPIIEANREVSGIFVEGVDVTEHVRVEEYLKILNNELKHRVKNTLSVISAIASRTLRGFGNDEVGLFRDRLAALGDAHDILTLDATGTAPLQDIVDAALAPFEFEEARFMVSGPQTLLGSKQALSLALALHELATNAVKYGALSDDHGRVGFPGKRRRDQSRPPRFLAGKRRSHRREAGATGVRLAADPAGSGGRFRRRNRGPI